MNNKEAVNQKPEVIVVLDNIRSIHNVGSIFRTADCAGVKKIYLCGTTPTPVDRFGRKRKDLAKVALGAEDSVSWKYFKTTEDAIKDLKSDKFEVVAVEQDKNSTNYLSYPLLSKTAFVFGREVEGVSTQILKQCDKIIEIPIYGKKESLNVSVTAGIILFCFLEKPRG